MLKTLILAAAVGLVLVGAVRAHAAEQWAIMSGDGQRMLIGTKHVEWFETDAIKKLYFEPEWRLKLFDSREAAEQHIRAHYNGFTRAVEWDGK